MESQTEQPLVGIALGSESDLPVMEGAVQVLRMFDVPYESHVLSAHRTPDAMAQYGRTAHLRGLRVLIAGAGGAAHLPGMLAAYTPLPVIGVPIPSRNLNGLDSLLSIVQMPRGVPVATVAIGNATNAAILAVQILAASDATLLQKIVEYKADLIEKVQKMDAGVRVKLGE